MDSEEEIETRVKKKDPKKNEGQGRPGVDQPNGGDKRCQGKRAQEAKNALRTDLRELVRVESNLANASITNSLILWNFDSTQATFKFLTKYSDGVAKQIELSDALKGYQGFFPHEAKDSVSTDLDSDDRISHNDLAITAGFTLLIERLSKLQQEVNKKDERGGAPGVKAFKEEVLLTARSNSFIINRIKKSIYLAKMKMNPIFRHIQTMHRANRQKRNRRGGARYYDRMRNEPRNETRIGNRNETRIDVSHQNSITKEFTNNTESEDTRLFDDRFSRNYREKMYDIYWATCNIPVYLQMQDLKLKKDYLVWRAVKKYNEFTHLKHKSYKSNFLCNSVSLTGSKDNNEVLPQMREWLIAKQMLYRQFDKTQEWKRPSEIEENSKKFWRDNMISEKHFSLIKSYSKNTNEYFERKFNGYIKINEEIMKLSRTFTIDEIYSITETDALAENEKSKKTHERKKKLQSELINEDDLELQEKLNYIRVYMKASHAKRYLDAMEILIVTPEGQPLWNMDILRILLSSPIATSISVKHAHREPFNDVIYSIITTFMSRLADFMCTEWPDQIIANYGYHLRCMCPMKGLNYVYWNGQKNHNPLLITRDMESQGQYRKFELTVNLEMSPLNHKAYEIQTNEFGVQESLESFWTRWCMADIWPSRYEIQHVILLSLFENNIEKPGRTPMGKINEWNHLIDKENFRLPPTYLQATEQFPRKTEGYLKDLAYNTYYCGMNRNKLLNKNRPEYSAVIYPYTMIPDICFDINAVKHLTDEWYDAIPESSLEKDKLSELARRRELIWTHKFDPYANLEDFTSIRDNMIKDKPLYLPFEADIEKEFTEMSRKMYQMTLKENEEVLKRIAKNLEISQDQISERDIENESKRLNENEVQERVLELVRARRLWVFPPSVYLAFNALNSVNYISKEDEKMNQSPEEECLAKLKIQYAQLLEDQARLNTIIVNKPKITVKNATTSSIDMSGLTKNPIAKDMIEADEKLQHDRIQEAKIKVFNNKWTKLQNLQSEEERERMTNRIQSFIDEMTQNLIKEIADLLDLQDRELLKEYNLFKNKYKSFSSVVANETAACYTKANQIKCQKVGFTPCMRKLMIHRLHDQELEVSRKFRYNVMIAIQQVLTKSIRDNQLLLWTRADADYLLSLQLAKYNARWKPRIFPYDDDEYRDDDPDDDFMDDDNFKKYRDNENNEFKSKDAERKPPHTKNRSMSDKSRFYDPSRKNDEPLNETNEMNEPNENQIIDVLAVTKKLENEKEYYEELVQSGKQSIDQVLDLMRMHMSDRFEMITRSFTTYKQIVSVSTNRDKELESEVESRKSELWESMYFILRAVSGYLNGKVSNVLRIEDPPDFEHRQRHAWQIVLLVQQLNPELHESVVNRKIIPTHDKLMYLQLKSQVRHPVWSAPLLSEYESVLRAFTEYRLQLKALDKLSIEERIKATLTSQEPNPTEAQKFILRHKYHHEVEEPLEDMSQSEVLHKYSIQLDVTTKDVSPPSEHESENCEFSEFQSDDELRNEETMVSRVIHYQPSIEETKKWLTSEEFEMCNDESKMNKYLEKQVYQPISVIDTQYVPRARPQEESKCQAPQTACIKPRDEIENQSTEKHDAQSVEKQAEEYFEKISEQYSEEYSEESIEEATIDPVDVSMEEQPSESEEQPSIRRSSRLSTMRSTEKSMKKQSKKPTKMSTKKPTRKYTNKTKDEKCAVTPSEEEKTNLTQDLKQSVTAGRKVDHELMYKKRMKRHGKQKSKLEKSIKATRAWTNTEASTKTITKPNKTTDERKSIPAKRRFPSTDERDDDEQEPSITPDHVMFSDPDESKESMTQRTSEEFHGLTTHENDYRASNDAASEHESTAQPRSVCENVNENENENENESIDVNKNASKVWSTSETKQENRAQARPRYRRLGDIEDLVLHTAYMISTALEEHKTLTDEQKEAWIDHLARHFVLPQFRRVAVLDHESQSEAIRITGDLYKSMTKGSTDEDKMYIARDMLNYELLTRTAATSQDDLTLPFARRYGNPKKEQGTRTTDVVLERTKVKSEYFKMPDEWELIPTMYDIDDTTRDAVSKEDNTHTHCIYTEPVSKDKNQPKAFRMVYQSGSDEQGNEFAAYIERQFWKNKNCISPKSIAQHKENLIKLQQEYTRLYTTNQLLNNLFESISVKFVEFAVRYRLKFTARTAKQLNVFTEALQKLEREYGDKCEGISDNAEYSEFVREQAALIEDYQQYIERLVWLADERLLSAVPDSELDLALGEGLKSAHIHPVSANDDDFKEYVFSQMEQELEHPLSTMTVETGVPKTSFPRIEEARKRNRSVFKGWDKQVSQGPDRENDKNDTKDKNNMNDMNNVTNENYVNPAEDVKFEIEYEQTDRHDQYSQPAADLCVYPVMHRKLNKERRAELTADSISQSEQWRYVSEKDKEYDILEYLQKQKPVRELVKMVNTQEKCEPVQSELSDLTSATLKRSVKSEIKKVLNTPQEEPFENKPTAERTRILETLLASDNPFKVNWHWKANMNEYTDHIRNALGMIGPISSSIDFESMIVYMTTTGADPESLIAQIIQEWSSMTTLDKFKKVCTNRDPTYIQNFIEGYNPIWTSPHGCRSPVNRLDRTSRAVSTNQSFRELKEVQALRNLRLDSMLRFPTDKCLPARCISRYYCKSTDFVIYNAESKNAQAKKRQLVLLLNELSKSNPGIIAQCSRWFWLYSDSSKLVKELDIAKITGIPWWSAADLRQLSVSAEAWQLSFLERLREEAQNSNSPYERPTRHVSTEYASTLENSSVANPAIQGKTRLCLRCSKEIKEYYTQHTSDEDFSLATLFHERFYEQYLKTPESSYECELNWEKFIWEELQYQRLRQPRVKIWGSIQNTDKTSRNKIKITRKCREQEFKKIATKDTMGINLTTTERRVYQEATAFNVYHNCQDIFNKYTNKQELLIEARYIRNRLDVPNEDWKNLDIRIITAGPFEQTYSIELNSFLTFVCMTEKDEDCKNVKFKKMIIRWSDILNYLTPTLDYLYQNREEFTMFATPSDVLRKCEMSNIWLYTPDVSQVSTDKAEMYKKLASALMKTISRCKKVTNDDFPWNSTWYKILTKACEDAPPTEYEDPESMYLEVLVILFKILRCDLDNDLKSSSEAQDRMIADMVIRLMYQLREVWEQVVKLAHVYDIKCDDKVSPPANEEVLNIPLDKVFEKEPMHGRLIARLAQAPASLLTYKLYSVSDLLDQSENEKSKKYNTTYREHVQLSIAWLNLHGYRVESPAQPMHLQDLQLIYQCINRQRLDMWVLTGPAQIDPEDLHQAVTHPYGYRQVEMIQVSENQPVQDWEFEKKGNITLVFNSTHVNLLNIQRMPNSLVMFVNEKGTKVVYQVNVLLFSENDKYEKIVEIVSESISDIYQDNKWKNDKDLPVKVMNKEMDIVDSINLYSGFTKTFMPIALSRLVMQPASKLASIVNLDARVMSVFTKRSHVCSKMVEIHQPQPYNSFSFHINEFKVELPDKVSQCLLAVKRIRQIKPDFTLFRDLEYESHPSLGMKGAKEWKKTRVLDIQQARVEMYQKAVARIVNQSPSEYKKQKEKYEKNEKQRKEENKYTAGVKEKYSVTLERTLDKELNYQYTNDDDMDTDETTRNEITNDLNARNDSKALNASKDSKDPNAAALNRRDAVTDDDFKYKIPLYKVYKQSSEPTHRYNILTDSMNQYLDAIPKSKKRILDRNILLPMSTIEQFYTHDAFSEDYYEAERRTMYHAQFPTPVLEDLVERKRISRIPHYGQFASMNRSYGSATKASIVEELEILKSVQQQKASKESIETNAHMISFETFDAKGYRTIVDLDENDFEKWLEVPVHVLTDQVYIDHVNYEYLETLFTTGITSEEKKEWITTDSHMADRSYKDLPPYLTETDVKAIRDGIMTHLILRLRKEFADHPGPELLTATVLKEVSKKIDIQDVSPSPVPPELDSQLDRKNWYPYIATALALRITASCIPLVSTRLAYQLRITPKDPLDSLTPVGSIRQIGTSSMTTRALEKYLMSGLKKWTSWRITCMGCPQFAYHGGQAQLAWIYTVMKQVKRSMSPQREAKNIVFLQLDIQKAFDNLSRDTMCIAIDQRINELKKEMPDRCVHRADESVSRKPRRMCHIECANALRLMIDIVSNSKCYLSLWKKPIVPSHGVVQGSSISPVLFNMSMKYLLRSNPVSLKLIEEGRIVQFADDLMIVADIAEIDGITTALQQVLKQGHMTLNTSKSRILVWPDIEPSLTSKCTYPKSQLVHVSEFLGVPISLDQNLIHVSIRKHCIDFAYQVWWSREKSMSIKISTVNNEWTRVLVPTLLTNILTHAQAKRIYEESLATLHGIENRHGALLRFIMPFEDVSIDFHSQLRKSLIKGYDGICWSVSLICLEMYHVYMRSTNLAPPSKFKNLGQCLKDCDRWRPPESTRKDKKANPHPYWQPDHIGLYVSLIWNDLSLESEYDFGNYYPVCSCKWPWNKTHRLRWRSKNVQHLRIGTPDFINKFYMKLYEFPDKVKTLFHEFTPFVKPRVYGDPLTMISIRNQMCVTDDKAIVCWHEPLKGVSRDRALVRYLSVLPRDSRDYEDEEYLRKASMYRYNPDEKKWCIPSPLEIRNDYFHGDPLDIRVKPERGLFTDSQEDMRKSMKKIKEESQDLLNMYISQKLTDLEIEQECVKKLEKYPFDEHRPLAVVELLMWTRSRILDRKIVQERKKFFTDLETRKSKEYRYQSMNRNSIIRKVYKEQPKTGIPTGPRDTDSISAEDDKSMEYD